MYGFVVMAITVTPRIGNSGPAQIDSLDGGRLDFAREWAAYFSTQPHKVDLRHRRYWDTEGPRPRPQPGSRHKWSTLEVRYGPTGVPGNVIDTTVGQSTSNVGIDDATTHSYRHLLLRPKGARVALLAAEVIGRARPVSRLLAAFRDDFQERWPDYWVEYETLTDGEYWNDFLANAEFVALNVTRHQQVPGFFNADGTGAEDVAIVKTRIEAAGRGRRLARALIPALLNQEVSPSQAFGLEFEPETASLVLESNGTQKTVVLDADQQPVFVYTLGDEDRRDRPPSQEFLERTTETLLRLLDAYPN